MPKPDIKPDHIHGGVIWHKPPTCKCGNVQRMFEEKFLFASRMNDGGTILYMQPVDADGDLTPRKGLSVSYCPSCGDKIVCQRSN